MAVKEAQIDVQAQEDIVAVALPESGPVSAVVLAKD
jgi:hypothetical protein